MNVLIDENTLEGIADAIRSATGSSDKMLMSSVPGKISEIKSKVPPNGKSWTKAFDGIFDKVEYADGVWLASLNGPIGATNYTGGLYRSTDGINWEYKGKRRIVEWIYYSNGIWVYQYTPPNGGHYIYYSSDGGVSWSEFIRINVSDSIVLRYANGLWILGIGKDGLYYSTNNLKSKTRSDSISFNTDSILVNDIKYANGMWICCTTNGMLYSTNGIDWLPCICPTSGGLSYVYNYNGMWFASQSRELGRISNVGMIYSTDGINWSNCIYGQGDIGVIVGYGYKILYNGKIFVAYYNDSILDGSQCLLYSSNGINWSSVPSGTHHKISNVYYANGIFVASSDIGVYYSINGTAWNSIVYGNESTTHGDLFFICNANGVWFMCGHGDLYYSYDGITWYANEDVNGAPIYRILNANGIWVLCSSNGLYYSKSAIND